MKSKQENKEVKRPSLLMHISEAFRAMGDYRRSKQFIKAFKEFNTGDGHPVLVIPGFMGSNTSTKRLRRFIKRLGFVPYDWGLGRNLAELKDIDVLLNQIDEIYEKHSEKISLIAIIEI